MGKRLKPLLCAFAFLLAPVFLPAQDNFGDGTNFPILNGEPKDYPLAGEEKKEKPPEDSQESQEPQEPEEKKELRIKNRTWELDILNVGVDFSNNFIAASDIIKNPFYLLKNINDIIQEPVLIWMDPIVVDLDRFFDGFQFNFGASIRPLSFYFNWKDKWGFGLDIGHIDITGNMELSGNLVTLSEAVEDKFGVGGAVFVEVGAPVFFHYRDFKIKVRPAAYVPLIYTEPNVTYTFAENANGTRFEISYDMKVYSLASMAGIQDGEMDAMTRSLTDNARDIPGNNLGYDFGLNVEYPWRYNLDIGVDVVNIPFAAAKLYHYMHIDGSVWMDTSALDIATIVGMNNRDQTLLDDSIYNTWEEFEEAYWATVYGYPEEFTAEYKINTGGKKIYRPFAMVFYANYRPLESKFLTLIPSLGFSINYLYPKIAAVEGGLSARLDLANMFITTLGINYNNRRWKNSIDFILNLRAFELDLGISLQSPEFARSWKGVGLGIDLGLKFGW